MLDPGFSIYRLSLRNKKKAVKFFRNFNICAKTILNYGTEYNKILLG